MRFTIVVAKRDTEPNAARYDDVAFALAASLRDLGHEVTGIDRPGRLIMFNASNLFDPARGIPEDAILYSTEQAAAVSDPRLTMLAYEEHRRRVVWDYSKANTCVLKDRLGLERVVHCPVGYHPVMARIEPVRDQDVDVLFYGAVNAHRAEVLDALDVSRLKVKRLYGVYGRERDQWIARSKVVLNLHFGFERGAVFEIFRCAHLLANRKCVVSESGGVDEALETFAKDATAYTARREIVERCRYLVDHTSMRRNYEDYGFEVFKRTSMVDSVKRALEQS